MTPPVTVTLTKSEWPYTRVQRRDVTLVPGESIRSGDGWIIAQIVYGKPGEPTSERDIFKPATDVSPDDGEAATPEEQSWLTWPPERQLEEGHEYLVRTKTGQQRYPREHRMSYLGKSGSHVLIFNARPFAGTQQFQVTSVFSTKDLGKSKGRDDPARYMNRQVH